MYISAVELLSFIVKFTYGITFFKFKFSSRSCRLHLTIFAGYIFANTLMEQQEIVLGGTNNCFAIVNTIKNVVFSSTLIVFWRLPQPTNLVSIGGKLGENVPLTPLRSSRWGTWDAYIFPQYFINIIIS